VRRRRGGGTGPGRARERVSAVAGSDHDQGLCGGRVSPARGPVSRLREEVRSRLVSLLKAAQPETFTEAQLRQLRELASPPVNVLDAYCTDVPSAQTAVDIFAGEWAARFPPPLTQVKAGEAPLFEIEHVPWGVDLLGGVRGQRVVELGPLEGGHTFILDRMGAREVVAVEANTRAFLKCLISKELLGIPSARFLCGDALRYLESELARGAPKFDLCLASGILYHFRNPVAALDLMTRISDRLLLWTMYFDEEYIRSRPDLSAKFTDATPAEYAGYRHTLYRQEYRESLDFRGFCGGSAADSAWMTRADVLGALDHFGFDVLGIDFEEQNHKGNGPCFCIAARRRGTR
jgi:SAM-dependent methyltransferase